MKANPQQASTTKTPTPKADRLLKVAANVANSLATTTDREEVRTAGLRLLEAYHEASVESSVANLRQRKAENPQEDQSDAIFEEADSMTTYTADCLAALAGTNLEAEALDEMRDLGTGPLESFAALAFCIFRVELTAALQNKEA